MYGCRLSSDSIVLYWEKQGGGRGKGGRGKRRGRKEGSRRNRNGEVYLPYVRIRGLTFSTLRMSLCFRGYNLTNLKLSAST